jgi:nitroimidazol reductase NimA-like FMN-containing flavoprotein (pyridoxamine 5'-phosphate oxidase superfamily)
MRRKEKEIKSRAKIDEIIKAAKVCRVGFVDGKKPYVLPFNFGYEKGVFYLHCAPEGRKMGILGRNDNACVEIDAAHKLKKFKTACKSGFKYKSVIAEGRAAVINDRARKVKALKILMKHQTGRNYSGFLEESLSRTRIIAIKVSKITGKQSGYG